MTHRITCTISDGIGRIVLDNPDNRNAVDLLFCEQWADAANRCADDDTLKVILIEARGKFFSVGGDLADFLDHADDLGGYISGLVAPFHAGIRALAAARPPIVVALNGMAAGGGFSIVCGADLVVAKRSARLNSGYTRSGLTPDGGGSLFLQQAVGRQKAFEIMALNETIDADEAQRLGLVTRVVDDALFDEEVERLVATLADAVPGVLGELKLLMRGAHDRTLHEHLDAEAVTMARCAGKPATIARLKTFLKR